MVGSENSSNTRALVRVAHNAGVEAHRVDSPEAIEAGWLDGHDVIAVTAGASAPDRRVQEVIAALKPTEGVDLVRVTTEDEYFPLPPSLRRFVQTLQAAVEGAWHRPLGVNLGGCVRSVLQGAGR